MSELKDFLTRDHERLDALLADCRQYATAPEGGRLARPVADLESYTEFRAGLLRHMGIEERILFPFLRTKLGVTAIEQQLHRDHAALAALLVPPPTAVEIEQIATLLAIHNDLEECEFGLYDMIEDLAGPELPEMVARIESFPEIPVAPFSDTPTLRRAIAHLLQESSSRPRGEFLNR